MMVIDASFAIEASLAGALHHLRGHEAVAPGLMWSEAASVLHEMKWRGAISAELAGEALTRINVCPIKMRRPRRLIELAWNIADKQGWAKTYDAEYVALAVSLKCPLLTLDAKLATRAAGVVRMIGPMDL